MDVVVEHYDAERIPNPNPQGELSDEEFYRVRRAIVAACRKHGKTGPDDGMDLPAYWVVDDQPNDELYQYIEVEERRYLSADWLRDIMTALTSFPGWGVGVINIAFGYLLVFENKLMVNGRPFSRCNDLESVAQAASGCLSVADEEGRLTGDRLHRQEVLASSQCACYYCCSAFAPSEIHDWTDSDENGIRQTAICPRCGQAKVVAARAGYELDLKVVRRLNKCAIGQLDERHNFENSRS